MEYLSTQWVQALDHALSNSQALQTAVGEGPHVVIEYRVDDHVHQVTLGPDGASAAAGAPNPATVTFSQSSQTAQAINKGTLSSEEAFITGQVTFQGNVQALLDHREAVAQVGDITASLRTKD